MNNQDKKPERSYSPNPIILPDPKNVIKDEDIQTNDNSCVENFTCSICYSLAWDPVFCPKCDNVFCRICRTNYGKFNKCPYRCDAVGFREITRNEMNFLDKINLKCNNEGCNKYINYSNYKSHLEKCELRLYHCKNEPCKEQGYLKNMIDHSKICIYRLIVCNKCKQLVKFCDERNHKKDICPEKIVKCNLCGSEMKREIYLKDHKSDNNENVNCLKNQIKKLTAVYTKQINYLTCENSKLKNDLNEIVEKTTALENENKNLKQKLNQMKQFYQDGYNLFWDDNDNENNNNISNNNNLINDNNNNNINNKSNENNIIVISNKSNDNNNSNNKYKKYNNNNNINNKNNENNIIIISNKNKDNTASNNKYNSNLMYCNNKSEEFKINVKFPNYENKLDNKQSSNIEIKMNNRRKEKGLSKTSLKTVKNVRISSAIKRVQSFDLFENNDDRNIKTDRNNK